MIKYYRFAGIDLQIEIPDPWMYEDDGDLTPFRVDAVEDPYVFRFEMVSELLPPVSDCIANTGSLRVYADGSRYLGSVEKTWEHGYAQVLPDGRQHHVRFKCGKDAKRVEVIALLNILGVEHLIAHNVGFFLHCSYIAVNGKAVLFTAASGTGKSTQADLWNRLRGAPVHNGDRCAVRWQEGLAYACGVPFAGSSQICENVTLPLGAIVYLRQAPKTTIRRLRGAESFRSLWEGCSVNAWDRADVGKISETVMQVLTAVPVFELACTPDESAILALEGVLTA